ncbi:MAG: flippase-like domain-containing protein [Bacteroidaceae bacterium]|nr:flippase-like domain-containing protein [Bacteroidaceae bacterium]
MAYLRKILKIVLPLILGGGILYWMYRNTDFESMKHLFLDEMNWWRMLLSFPFGISAQVFRGLRWKQTLEPIGEEPRTSTAINSIFISYAASLVIPRIGEFSRCAILKKHDGISFTKSLGTVVTERAVDTLIMGIMTAIILLLQMPVFASFFMKTGTKFDTIFTMFTQAGWIVTAICGIAALIGLWIFRRHIIFYDKVKTSVEGIVEGVMSLKKVKNVPLFVFYSLGIWASYFLHYYLTFFCFNFTAELGLNAALVTFIVGTVAVIVPTPNGAGPWHFAVKTMLVLYGVAELNALGFVFVVHTVQTMLVVALGLYAMAWLSITHKTETSNIKDC